MDAFKRSAILLCSLKNNLDLIGDYDFIPNDSKSSENFLSKNYLTTVLILIPFSNICVVFRNHFLGPV
jgi:hypothetical protein